MESDQYLKLDLSQQEQKLLKYSAGALKKIIKTIDL